MLVKIAFNSILVILLSLVQLSFISVLPFPFNELNLIIVVLVFVLALSAGLGNIWFFLLIGLMFDLYSLLFFGFFLLLWPLVFLFARFMFINFFTNRSLYSFLLLNSLTLIFYFVLSYLLSYFYSLFNDQGHFFLLIREVGVDILAGLIISSVLIVVLFYIFNFLSNRLSPVFIWKKK